jgi:hypothetical protein
MICFSEIILNCPKLPNRLVWVAVEMQAALLAQMVLSKSRAGQGDIVSLVEHQHRNLICQSGGVGVRSKIGGMT